ncbi:SWIM zinc finger family protein [Bartonella sp. HY761]|uniref:SWIM zinc finger family protein n=1 Tax=Bartonella sp. HY761 TaxID=2979330 RepID=UPI0021FC8D8B|nr:SWIM zinc finger family protein [Bartonella sp. HY761]UXN06333.1 SWIM zinc finger family protein [Bartonella sp. HY761]
MVSIEKIEQIAPDQASLAAASKLRKASKWPTLACDDGGLVWGECQGSGSTPYRTVFCESDMGYKCNCPSRKFPCKHSLAIMWMRAETPTQFVEAERPDWVSDWLSRRRGPSTAAKAGSDKADDKPKPKLSADLASLDIEKPLDPEDAAKAAKRSADARERSRKQREKLVGDGLDALDIWLSDQISRGLNGFDVRAISDCRILAARLVDAKAGGLASRVDQLSSAIFGLNEALRADFALKQLGVLHIIAMAYRNREALPPLLHSDLLETIGWNVEKEALCQDAQALRIKADWQVVGTSSVVQPDKLRRNEIWLIGKDSNDQWQKAVLLDFFPLSVGLVGLAFAVGDCFSAELVFYPSPVPRRALIAEQSSATQTRASLTVSGQNLQQSFNDYQQALTLKPWLTQDLLMADNVHLYQKNDGLYVVGEKICLPVHKDSIDEMRLLGGVGAFTLFALWDGTWLRALSAQTTIGLWRA